MLNITYDSLTQSGTGCFIAVPIWQQWPSKVYTHCLADLVRISSQKLIHRKTIMMDCQVEKMSMISTSGQFWHNTILRQTEQICCS